MGKNYTSLDQIQKDLVDGSLHLSDLVKHYLENIDKHNERLNVFLEVFAEEAILKAQEINKKVKAGNAGKLFGLVVGIKDVICYKDHRVSCGSKIIEDFESQFSATCVERLIAEDAIIIGRQNCDEFAMGSSTENSAFGPTLNGLGENRVPGGSSGASAVAVQMDMCQASLGSDTGGSVRQPAAFCGIYGLKPTYSRISRHGLTAYASSFDIIGVLSKSIEDAAKILEVTAGKDDYDSTVSHEPVEPYAKLQTHGKKRIGYIKEIVDSEYLDEEMKECFKDAISKLEDKGHEIKELHFHYLDYLLPTYYILTTAEASSNLSRFDGVRYGHRSSDSMSLEEMYKNSRTEGFGEEVLRRIMLGTFVLSASYYDAFFTKAQKARRLIKDSTIELFDECDFIISPTTAGPAFGIGENTQDPIQMYLADLYTVQASLSGIPAISLPVGKNSEDMPLGIQVIANSFQERDLLSFSKELVGI